MKEAQSKQHLLYLDGLRALAALFVVIHHTVLQFFDFDMHGLKGPARAFVKFFWEGHLAVDLFIVLSGFCLMMPVVLSQYTLKGGALKFYKKRAYRILPPYYIATLVSLLLIAFFIGNKTHTHWDASIPVTYKDVILHLLLIHDLFFNHAFTINHSFWSVSVESRIYIFFPLLVWLWSKYGSKTAVVVSVIISALLFLIGYYIHLYKPNYSINLSGVNPYIILFSLGMLAADLSFSDKKFFVEKFKVVFSILFILSVLVFLVVRKPPEALTKPNGDIGLLISDIAFGLSCALLLVNLNSVNNKTWVFKGIYFFLQTRLMAFLGTFAYSIYLIHAPLVQLLTLVIFKLNIHNRVIATIILSTAGPVVIVAISYLFFLLFERPFIKSKRALKDQPLLLQ